MRAVIHDRYGPPEVLRVDEVERPVPNEDEVLVRVHASTVTRGDTMGVRSAEYRFRRADGSWASIYGRGGHWHTFTRMLRSS